MPTYAHPPNSFGAPSARVRTRRMLLRIMALPLRSQTPTSAAPRRLLVIRPDHLGDLLFVGPALRWLHSALPDAYITLAIGPWARPALPGLIGSFDDLVTIAFPGFERGTRAGLVGRWSLLPRIARHLQAGRFDTALILRPDHWWGAMLTAWAGIPRRWGYATPETTPWLTDALPLPHEHAVASNLRLVSACSGQPVAAETSTRPLRFALDLDNIAAASALLQSPPGSPPPAVVVIHPGSGAAVKQWEPAKWAEIARRLAGHGQRVVVTGGPDETTLTSAVVAQSGGSATDLGGRTDFGVLAALLAQAKLVIGPDSGPLHLAVAVGAPTVHLYGPADPVRYGPWGDPARHIVIQSGWDCAPCGQFAWPDLPAHNCVRDISVEQVWAAAAPLLSLA